MIVIKAKYIIQDNAHYIENGAVAIEGNKIRKVGTFDEVKVPADNATIIDLKNTALLPGLINTHAHLDLTSLKNRIAPTNNFTHWVFQLVGAKARWKADDYAASIKEGIALCIESGTTTVADITHSGHSFPILEKSPLRKVVYKEIIGLNPAYAQKIISKASLDLSDISTTDSYNIGISPHAPYSVSKELYKAASRLAKEKNLLVCTHIAETQDEIEFLAKGTGNLPVLLQKLKAIPDGWQPPERKPIQYLYEAGVLNEKMLLIHCNYLTEEEMSMIRSSGASVAFCPKSHHFFGHKNHPLSKLLEEGINVGLGTDSLASNDTLDILEEMKFLYAHYSLPPEVIFSIATKNGAKALGMETNIGQIREGFEADMCGIRLTNNSTGNVYEQILDTPSKNIFTMVAGAVCYNAND
ncbi:MAG: amidohydrolase family protein [Candidatus Kuenenia sp.]|nr:amidohydrolase family protein [Candidatus Kuenenia hertensis]